MRCILNKNFFLNILILPKLQYFGIFCIDATFKGVEN